MCSNGWVHSYYLVQEGLELVKGDLPLSPTRLVHRPDQVLDAPAAVCEADRDKRVLQFVHGNALAVVCIQVLEPGAGRASERGGRSPPKEWSGSERRNHVLGLLWSLGKRAQFGSCVAQSIVYAGLLASVIGLVKWGAVTLPLGQEVVFPQRRVHVLSLSPAVHPVDLLPQALTPLVENVGRLWC